MSMHEEVVKIRGENRKIKASSPLDGDVESLLSLDGGVPAETLATDSCDEGQCPSRPDMCFSAEPSNEG